MDCPACKKPLLVPIALKSAEAASAPATEDPAPRVAPGAKDVVKDVAPIAPALSLVPGPVSKSTPAESSSSSEPNPEPEPKPEPEPEPEPELELKLQTEPEPAGFAPAADASTPVTGTASASPTETPADTPAPATEVAPVSENRVAVLTPALKLEIVRAIRTRIADPARWIPGKQESGKYQYAARIKGRESVPVEPADATATHHSLFGAVLLEFHRRNVYKVSPDRRQFLDEELTAAIQEVLGRTMGGATVSEADREALTHPQCLAVLDTLEQRYERDASAAEKLEVESKIEKVRLVDLVKKLEHGTPVLAEDVAAALYYEVEALNQRLDRMEAAQKSGS